VDAGLRRSAWSAEASFTVPGSSAGDANDDRRIDAGDIFFIINHVKNDGPKPGNGDLNGDGAVSDPDIQIAADGIFLEQGGR
jgi:hypothetical protein